jgi:hypothetical protein
MLLPSILIILDQDRRRLDSAALPNANASAALADDALNLRKAANVETASAEPVKPAEVPADSGGIAPTGPFFEELLRAITKLEKPDESRVVDVFE